MLMLFLCFSKYNTPHRSVYKELSHRIIEKGRITKLDIDKWDPRKFVGTTEVYVPRPKNLKNCWCSIPTKVQILRQDQCPNLHTVMPRIFCLFVVFSSSTNWRRTTCVREENLLYTSFISISRSLNSWGRKRFLRD